MEVLPKLYAILDSDAAARRGAALPDVAQGMIEGGARLLQLRHKGHYSRALYAEAQHLAKLCREAGARFIVNDRADIALLLGAGVHLGQDDLPPADARRLLGPRAMIGFSTHTAEQLASAGREPVDYLAIGPVFATQSKENPDPVLGVERVAELRKLTEKPLVAIGGITLDSAPRLLRAGVDSVAVIRALIPATYVKSSVRARVEEWVRALDML
ncbi:MAG: Thiamine-phosphate synthase [Bryobacteraceae bacterium]|nr:Thiamine-phosphate synthase [Bryobacteraceae bacterium]